MENRLASSTRVDIQAQSTDTRSTFGFRQGSVRVMLACNLRPPGFRGRGLRSQRNRSQLACRRSLTAARSKWAVLRTTTESLELIPFGNTQLARGGVGNGKRFEELCETTDGKIG